MVSHYVMRKLVILMMFAFCACVEAQNVKDVDSVDVPQVAQIPFNELDSLTMSSLDVPYPKKMRKYANNYASSG